MKNQKFKTCLILVLLSFFLTPLTSPASEHRTKCYPPGDYLYSPLMSVPDYGLFSSEHIVSIYQDLSAHFENFLNHKTNQVADLQKKNKKLLSYPHIIHSIEFISGDLESKTFELGLMVSIKKPLPKVKLSAQGQKDLENEEVTDENSAAFQETPEEYAPFFVATVVVDDPSKMDNPDFAKVIEIKALRQEYFWRKQYFGKHLHKYDVKWDLPTSMRKGDPMEELFTWRSERNQSENALINLRQEILTASNKSIPKEYECQD